MPSDIAVRRMTLGDLEPVAAIEEATFAHPWTRQDYTDELTRNKAARYLVAETAQGEIAGFAGAWIILDESHITNIAVAEGFRRRGIGRKVTEALLQYLSNLGAAYATLEVRESNLPAQSLYRALGFLAVGRRKRYYEDNGEDALIMVCDRMPPADPDFEEPETVHEEA
jgi:ribosomal-protein-alanine N-acetyltransferase